MPNVPDTRQSLILRLRDHADSVAWREFAELYEPIVYRVARHQGLQDADALETVQAVMISVARAVQNWEPTGPAQFRSWLMRIVRNKLIDHLRRKSRVSPGAGDSAVQRSLQERVDSSAGLSPMIEREYRRELFHRAAGRIQEQVQPETWSAFWQTSIEGRDIREVAESLGTSPGAVHIARSRVLARLRQYVEDYENRITDRRGIDRKAEVSES